jgi:hypothetical protein
MNTPPPRKAPTRRKMKRIITNLCDARGQQFARSFRRRLAGYNSSGGSNAEFHCRSTPHPFRGRDRTPRRALTLRKQVNPCPVLRRMTARTAGTA